LNKVNDTTPRYVQLIPDVVDELCHEFKLALDARATFTTLICDADFMTGDVENATIIDYANRFGIGRHRMKAIFDRLEDVQLIRCEFNRGTAGVIHVCAYDDCVACIETARAKYRERAQTARSMVRNRPKPGPKPRERSGTTRASIQTPRDVELQTSALKLRDLWETTDSDAILGDEKVFASITAMQQEDNLADHLIDEAMGKAFQVLENGGQIDNLFGWVRTTARKQRARIKVA
jgi:hypothetical protein